MRCAGAWLLCSGGFLVVIEVAGHLCLFEPTSPLAHNSFSSGKLNQIKSNQSYDSSYLVFLFSLVLALDKGAPSTFGV